MRNGEEEAGRGKWRGEKTYGTRGRVSCLSERGIPVLVVSAGLSVPAEPSAAPLWNR